MSYPAVMREVPFVKKEDAAFAREIEKRLLAVRDDAGILFVGVSVRPTTLDESPLFHVWVGCSRSTSEDLMGPLVANLFSREIAGGTQIKVEAHRGIIRA